MHNRPQVYIGNDAIQELIAYCQDQKFEDFTLVADRNTYSALGQQVESALLAQGFDVLLALVEGDEVIADERCLMQVFLKADRKERVYLAVGSGTLTDITRFVSHRTRTSFIPLPTAPSVDGFTSTGAPLVVGGLKRTYLCQPPLAIFAGLPVLCSAPRGLVAAGFGDMVGKLLAAADWELGHLLWDERFDPRIKERSREAALRCAAQAGQIGRGEGEAMRILMEGLVESGFCMLDFGNSNPASGAEHHISHFWEMKLLNERRKPVFHGLKVGIASVLTARWYDAVSRLSAQQVAGLLEKARLPEPEAQARDIRSAYGQVAGQVIQDQADFISISAQGFSQLKERILDRWPEVLRIAAEVPRSEQLVSWLREAGAPVSGEEIGLSRDEILLGVEYGHYLRNRFTINKLRGFLGLPGLLATGGQ